MIFIPWLMLRVLLYTFVDTSVLFTCLIFTEIILYLKSVTEVMSSNNISIPKILFFVHLLLMVKELILYKPFDIFMNFDLTGMTEFSTTRAG